MMMMKKYLLILFKIFRGIDCILIIQYLDNAQLHTSKSSYRAAITILIFMFYIKFWTLNTTFQWSFIKSSIKTAWKCYAYESTYK